MARTTAGTHAIGKAIAINIQCGIEVAPSLEENY